jgi:hypothetical protein
VNRSGAVAAHIPEPMHTPVSTRTRQVTDRPR